MVILTRSFLFLPIRYPVTIGQGCKLKIFTTLQKCGRLKARSLTSALSGSDFKTQSHEDFRELIIDSATEKKVKLILMEFMLLRQTQNVLPDELEKRDMFRLLEIESHLGRTNYIVKYLSNRAKHKLAKQQRQEKRKLERADLGQELTEREGTGYLQHGLGHNCLHFRIRDRTVKAYYAQRLAQAAQFGPRLVFDCGFEDHMNRRECMNAAVQLQNAYGLNFVHRTPFDLHFCNLKSDSSKSIFLQCLEKMIPNLHCPTNMITVSDKDYTDFFLHKRKLIYLSPDAKEVMTDFDEDAVYIIGVLVDLGRKIPRTLAKAKKDQIQCLKLPLDSHLLFKPGACKSLPLNQVMRILLELHSSGDWSRALGAVASRAVYTPQQILARAEQKHFWHN